MGALGQAEGKYAPLRERLRRLPLDRFVLAHPDRAQAQDRDLPGVPVGQPVEGDDLVELAVAVGVPPRVGIGAVLGGRQQSGKDLILFDEIKILPVPDPLVIVILDAAKTLSFEEVDGLQHYVT